jgi:predicted ABC-type ATPase
VKTCNNEGGKGTVIEVKIYTIIAGVNGAGKSSLAGVLRTEMRNLGKIIDVDKIIAKCNGNMYEGGKKSVELINDCLAKEICFTQETTLSGHSLLKNVKVAIEKGYYIRLYYVGLNTVEESIARIENRVRKGGHDIPSSDVMRRFENRFENLCKVLPYCDEATFYDNENGFVAVAEYKNGEMLQIGSQSPAWLNELKNYLEKN